MLKKIIKELRIRHRLPLVGVLCLLVVYMSGQSYLSTQINEQLIAAYTLELTHQKPDSTKKPAAKPQKASKLIKVIYSSLWDKGDAGIDVLTDSVQFLHEGAYLFCDSAYFNRDKNTFEAFSNVRMEQGDTLFLFGDYMHYDGNTKLVRVRENVKMDHRSGTLFTDSLNYDRGRNIAYYFDGGMLVDSLNELTSYKGQYQPALKLATFTEEVVLDNPNFKLYSDTLLYTTDTKIATIVSPSKIESDSGTIYSSRGWYNTTTERSLLLDQSLVVNKAGNQRLKGDSILYYRTDNSGEVFGNMFLQDTTKRMILKGNYGFYDGAKEYAYATDSASAIEYSQGDSLYLHADLLEMIKLPPVRVLKVNETIDTVKWTNEEQIQKDSLVVHRDSTYLMQAQHEMKGYYGVRFYRSDMQGVCDSIQFSSIDSVLYMYKDPILWNLDRQMTGDTIQMYMNDSTMDRMYVIGSAFSIEQKDSIHFNQLKSRTLKSYFENGKLNRIFGEGNVETIAFPEERDGTLNEILVQLQSSYLEIYLVDGVFERLKYITEPIGKAIPFHLVEPSHLRLDNFYWYDYMRPLDKDDIFRKATRKAGDIRPPRPKFWDREEE